MAFESLTDRLAGVFKKLRGHGKLTEADIKAAMREVRMALLEADVNYKVAKDFCAKVSERAMGQEVMESLTPAHPCAVGHRVQEHGVFIALHSLRLSPAVRGSCCKWHQ